MIVGLGTDIVEIARIKETLERHQASFEEHVFTETERVAGAGRKDSALYYAGRWAAKEALSKALGCGISEKCHWLDIEIYNGDKGNPRIKLSGAAAESAEAIGVSEVHVSISHEKHYASATVILESCE